MQGGPGKDNEGKDDETARIQPGLGSRPRLPALTLGAPARASWRRRRCARAGPAAPRPPARSLYAVVAAPAAAAHARCPPTARPRPAPRARGESAAVTAPPCGREGKNLRGRFKGGGGIPSHPNAANSAETNGSFS